MWLRLCFEIVFTQFMTKIIYDRKLIIIRFGDVQEIRWMKQNLPVQCFDCVRCITAGIITEEENSSSELTDLYAQLKPSASVTGRYQSWCLVSLPSFPAAPDYCDDWSTTSSFWIAGLVTSMMNRMEPLRSGWENS